MREKNIFLAIIILQLLENKAEFYREDAKKYFFVGLMGIASAAIFWLPLIIKYHGQTLNNWQQYTSQTIMPSAEVVSAMFQESMRYGSGVISWIAFGIIILELLTKLLQFVPSKTLTENVQFSSFVVFTASIKVRFV